jgi:hypothetical protein
MPEETIKHCLRCKHWEPLFTGEQWGVRSFLDAPVEAQAEVKAKLAAQSVRDGWANVGEALDWMDGPTDASFTADKVPGGPDWPEWGECERTRLEGNSTPGSLAMAIDGSMYHAVLRCHGRFGCIQWEAE